MQREGIKRWFKSHRVGVLIALLALTLLVVQALMIVGLVGKTDAPNGSSGCASSSEEAASASSSVSLTITGTSNLQMPWTLAVKPPQMTTDGLYLLNARNTNGGIEGSVMAYYNSVSLRNNENLLPDATITLSHGHFVQWGEKSI